MGLISVPGTHPWLSHECPGYSTGVIRVLGHFDTRLGSCNHQHNTQAHSTWTLLQWRLMSPDGETQSIRVTKFCSQLTNLSSSDKNVYHLHDITTHSTHMFRIITDSQRFHNGLLCIPGNVSPLPPSDGWQLQIPRATRRTILLGQQSSDLLLSLCMTRRCLCRSHAAKDNEQGLNDADASQTIRIYGWMC
jgi:hypothetical protein